MDVVITFAAHVLRTSLRIAILVYHTQLEAARYSDELSFFDLRKYTHIKLPVRVISAAKRVQYPDSFVKELAHART